MKKALIVIALIVLLALIVVFAFVPAQVERSMNRVLNAPPYQASDKAKALHQQLFVADLQADSLLWNRNLLEHSTRGHGAV